MTTTFADTDAVRAHGCTGHAFYRACAERGPPGPTVCPTGPGPRVCSGLRGELPGPGWRARHRGRNASGALTGATVTNFQFRGLSLDNRVGFADVDGEPH